MAQKKIELEDFDKEEQVKDKFVEENGWFIPSIHEKYIHDTLRRG